MRRREFVRTMVTAAAAPKLLLAQSQNPAPPPPAPVPWTVGLTPATPVPTVQVAEAVAEGELRFFTPVQMATLTRLSDVLMPPIGSKPGAVSAGVPAFLDFLVGESPADRKQMYQGGLDWLDAEAKKRYSQPFAKLDAVQADALLKPWLRTWMSDHPPLEKHADFINVAHTDIRAATVNSKPWNDAPAEGAQERTQVALYWYPIEPDPYCMRSKATPVPKRGTKPTQPGTEIRRNY
ncbi:gluconate 2-dehydrogenase subunit 3 family protein [Edaphobacter aggregans]|uniref:gluconate 2-dehydrogenase subunit 3 family protein n=1 Tax=Edaphobacter aggregans TaxID=570835 RepID=UPI00068BD37E|nr:gluconate 2-dehydrogenase subunit 3 family protein [Edaphobacter aggregans]